MLLASLNSFAGGSGGGGVLMNRIAGDAPEIVYHMGQQDGLVQFAYGQLVDNQWKIQKIEMNAADLKVDTAVMNALRDSKSLNSWVKIK